MSRQQWQTSYNEVIQNLGLEGFMQKCSTIAAFAILVGMETVPATMAAKAQEVPSAEYRKDVSTCNIVGGSCLPFGTGTNDSDTLTLTGATSFASASSVDGPFPTVYAAVSETAVGPFTAPSVAAGSRLDYYFRVESPNKGPVPVIFASLTALFAQESGTSGTRIQIFGIGTGILFERNFHCGFGLPIFAVAGALQECGYTAFLSGLDFLAYKAGPDSYSGMIRIHAAASAPQNGLEVSTASSWIDPVITIDPDYLRLNPGAQVLVSSGIGNGQLAVPEPPGWAIMIFGFGFCGIVLRRRNVYAYVR